MSVESGDMIICDCDGVVVVPFFQIDEVLDKLEPLKTAEARVEAKIKSGLTEPEYLKDLMTSDKTVYLE
jgi:4-hydroxy-4-methyl-2-oxoglutarate aldolase